MDILNILLPGILFCFTTYVFMVYLSFYFECLILFLILITILLFLYTHYTDFSKKFNKLLVEPYVPLIGSLDALRYNPKNMLDRKMEPFQKDGGYWILGFHVYVSSDVNIVQQILSECLSKNDQYEFLKKSLGPNAIIATDVKTWKVERKIAIPSLKTNLFPEFFSVFNSHTDKLLNTLEYKSKKGEFDFKYIIGILGLNIVAESLLGREPDEIPFSEEYPEFFETYLRVAELTCEPTFSPWLINQTFWKLSGKAKLHQEGISSLKKSLNKLTLKAQEKLSRQFDENSFKTNLLDIICKNWKDPNEIFFHVAMFFAATIDTTNISLSSCFFFLAKNPQIQDKLLKDVQSVWDGYENISIDQVNEMKYLEMVLKESMRIITPVPIIGRKTDKQIVLKNGQVLPAGTNINIPVWKIHTDPKIYPEPEKFKPERFSTEESTKRHPCAYLPFSIGQRNCIGQKYVMLEMKVILAKVISRFEISSSKACEDLNLKLNLPFSDICGELPLTFKKR